MISRPAALMVALTLGFLAAPLVGAGQPGGGVPRIGYLSASSRKDLDAQRRLTAFQQGLHELGYVQGKNIAIEERWAEEKWNRLPDLASDLVRLKVDVIVTGIVPAIQAAQRATKTIPIVMAIVADPVATGLVTNIARPGGNITGLSMIASEVVGKQLELLRDAVPRISRVAVLWDPDNPGNVPQVRAAETAGQALHMPLQLVAVRAPSEVDQAFATITAGRADGLLLVVDAMLLSRRHRIGQLAITHRLPSVSGARQYAEGGGLLSYGVNAAALYGRAARYVDKILKGAKPGDLPIEQPTQFDLVINMKTARALGLTIPRSLLLRVDQVIE
jgi:putative ABC transport system substrate-binding protein